MFFPFSLELEMSTLCNTMVCQDSLHVRSSYLLVDEPFKKAPYVQDAENIPKVLL